MNEMMLAILGFATIFIIITMLLKNVTVSALAFAFVSTVAAVILVLTGTFSINEVGGFISKGVTGTSSNANSGKNH